MATELTYHLAGASWSLVLEASVVSFLMGQAQRGRTSRERIGQLYSRDLSSTRIVIDAATQLEPLQSSYAIVDFRRGIAQLYGLRTSFLARHHEQPNLFAAS